MLCLKFVDVLAHNLYTHTSTVYEYNDHLHFVPKPWPVGLCFLAPTLPVFVYNWTMYSTRKTFYNTRVNKNITRRNYEHYTTKRWITRELWTIHTLTITIQTWTRNKNLGSRRSCTHFKTMKNTHLNNEQYTPGQWAIHTWTINNWTLNNPRLEHH